jgi:chemotaxis protein MotA
MDFASAIGLIVGIALIIGAIMLEGNASLYVSIHGLMIAVGGVIASICLAYPMKDVLKVIKYLKEVFFVRNRIDQEKLVDMFEDYARMIRKDGLIAMEYVADRLNDAFYKQACQLIADGTDSEKFQDIMIKDIEATMERNKVGQDIFRFGIAAGPAFGLIGAVIGIIQMLGALGEGNAGPETIAKMAGGMSMALCATLYGITLAYLIFAPISQKLGRRSEEETSEKMLLLEGFLALQAGDPAQVVRQRMEAMLPYNQRKSLKTTSSTKQTNI